MTATYLYIAFFIVGFLLAWLLRTMIVVKLKKELNSTKGFLESEKLKKETLNKENQFVYQQKKFTEDELQSLSQEATDYKKFMDESLVLLQKDNEETEKLLKAGQPLIHDLKMKLIEANNTIARYKAQLEQKK
ncbi:MAG TPA: hypothetical protein PLN30_04730 [Ferruginibacter sp.]|nr:hypothetical protein [Chitinophagaceae bacterium]HRD43029.1 hypothetical protein [Ferruginibacter sp.]